MFAVCNILQLYKVSPGAGRLDIGMTIALMRVYANSTREVVLLKLKLLNMVALISAVIVLLAARNGEAYTSLNGYAELSYVNYKGKTDASSFSGDTFAQRYSLAYTATNLFHRDQRRYYDMTVGYDWLNFDTQTSTKTHKTRINDVFGKLRYNGSVGYNPSELPIFFTAYASDANRIYFKHTPGEVTLMPNNLIYDIEGKYKAESFGATLIYDPDLARNVTLRGLPRMHLAYDETFVNTLGGYYKLDYKVKNISVAGLGKGNNWLQFRSTDFVDNLASANNYNQKQFQIGLVNTKGNRLWSALTNWITVSADGQFTNRGGASGFEEYDLNFMAIASRRAWQARTFMNYNRNSQKNNGIATDQETVASIPVYVQGIYGPETTWFTRFSFTRGQLVDNLRTNDSYANKVSVGGTTFTRSRFTLSPTLTVATSKNYNDSFARLNLRASLETNSTALYSRTSGIAAGTYFDYVDDGYDSDLSQTWKQHFFLNVNYRPDSKYIYTLRENLEVGDGLPPLRGAYSAGTQNYATGNQKYFTSRTEGSLTWTPTAALSNGLNIYYNYGISEDIKAWQEMSFSHRFSYTTRNTFYRFDTRFVRTDNGSTSGWLFSHSGDVQYKPDRYNDGLLRYTYEKQNDEVVAIGNYPANTREKMELLERYSYEFYSRTGVIRKLATLTQEFTITGDQYLNNRRYTYDFTIGGRYSPTERLSLYGSVKYENTDTGQETFFYNGGLAADFKLLSASCEYAYAKRPSDNRVEKRLSAAVRRVF